ncbi:hypothetical protein POX_g08595 [Penicillium oxalicum]|uniref:Uncharacterized protein n=1 Tax=Penicillium oxalicum (strain 114-2 / CGMCC 5302) TaxID=933388 RepID=S8AYP7_PENO1|nr:hypothetical protein POX_g08595 [Penicillium oxalicum]EPS27107.1 hypothetical protein PDE_02048 [Penicillium oxalicum 114-2]KAI2786213.1 hypothetical protein POX_g08595 [Penicillium oxalicum]
MSSSLLNLSQKSPDVHTYSVRAHETRISAVRKIFHCVVIDDVLKIASYRQRGILACWPKSCRKNLDRVSQLARSETTRSIHLGRAGRKQTAGENKRGWRDDPSRSRVSLSVGMHAYIPTQIQ